MPEDELLAGVRNIDAHFEDDTPLSAADMEFIENLETIPIPDFPRIPVDPKPFTQRCDVCECGQEVNCWKCRGQGVVRDRWVL